VKIDRRTVLRGIGGATLALPFLEIMRPRTAQAQTRAPKRFLVFFHHQGMVMRDWRPRGSETDFSLPYLLEPLEPFRDRMVIIHGVGNGAGARLATGDDHNRARNNLLTGGGYGNGEPWQLLSDRISIDQELAGRLRSDVPFASINLAIGTDGQTVSGIRSGIFHHGANDPVTSIADPNVAFDRVFSGFSPDGMEDPASARLRSRRTSVLDAVKQSFDSLRNRVGVEDRERLDAHAEKVRSLERRLTMGPQSGNSCSLPVITTPPGYSFPVHDDVTAPAMIELMTMAFACKRTNVGTIYFGSGQDPRFPWLSFNGGPVLQPGYDTWHTMVHQGQHEAALLLGFRFYSEMFRSLLDRLSQTQDEDGSLLDSTCVLWISDFGDGSVHNRNNLAIVLAGNPGVTTGRFINHPDNDYQSVSQHDTMQLYTSILNAFGFPDTSFGPPGSPPGPLAGL
jgi:hypothetical protein